MLIESLQSIFTRDLWKLRSEIELYREEKNIWKFERHISNSAGNLCLHSIGNLNAHIGKEIGKTGYIRKRELEFSLKDVPKNELLSQVDDTIQMVNTVLGKLDEASLSDEYPIPVSGQKVSTGYILVHLATHLDYHLGQINYHRRLID